VRCGDRSCSVDGSCPLNSPPRLQLQPVPATDGHGIVQVPRGWLYNLCQPGTAGTLSEPCEPGALLYTLTLFLLPTVLSPTLFRMTSVAGVNA
jgi:hypothetical protein